MLARIALDTLGDAIAAGDAASGRLSGWSGEPLLRYEGVCFSAGTTEILHGIDVSLNHGAPTVLLGPNGSGKTTFLKLAMGLIAPASGRMMIDPSLRKAFVFQKPVMLRRTVAANVTYALTTAGRSTDQQTVDRLLVQAHLAPLAERPARRLSGGEQQRLALARALAREPDILFLDEPTASLDPAQTRLVEEIIATVAAAGVKIVMATHDIGQARRLAGDVVLLVRGRLVEHTAATSFFTNPATDAARRFVAGDLVL